MFIKSVTFPIKKFDQWYSQSPQQEGSHKQVHPIGSQQGA